MPDFNPVLLIAGFTIGTLSVFLPTKIWLGEGERINLNAFKKRFPRKKWLPFLFQFLPLVWLATYAFILFPNYFSWFGLGNDQAYFIAYLSVAGIGLGDGLLEIVTKVSPVRSYMGGSLQLRYMIHNQFVCRFGLLRVGFITGVGFASWLVFKLLTL